MKTCALRPDRVGIRLAPLAARSGQSINEFAQSVLLHHAHEQEQRLAGYAEDDARWERYLATGESIPAEVVLAELDDMAAEAVQLQKS